MILAANLIDRRYNPAQFLAAVHERLNLGAVLLLTSPSTWLSEHTPSEAWLGFSPPHLNATLGGLKPTLRYAYRQDQSAPTST